MFNYVLRRILWMIPTMFGITLLVFLAIRAAPGDPAVVMMGVASGGEMESGVDYEKKIEEFRVENGLEPACVVDETTS